MANLYEINNQILECMDIETGEVIDYEKLKTLNIEKNEKLENIALYIKNLVAESEAIKAEIKVMSERKEQKEKKIIQLKEYLANVLENQKFETPKVSISYRKSASINILDETKIDKEFIKEVITTSIDKMALKEAIKSGKNIEGAELVEKQNIQIK